MENKPDDVTRSFHVRNPEVEDTMRAIGRRVTGALPKGWGFALFIFDETREDDPTKSAVVPGADSATFYICSHERPSVVRMLREWIAKSEAAGKA